MPATRAAVKRGDVDDSVQVAAERNIVESATTCSQLADLMVKHSVQVPGRGPDRLQRIKAQLRRLIPQPAGQAARAQPAKVAEPQPSLPIPPPTRSLALPSDEVLLQPPAPPAGLQTASKSRKAVDQAVHKAALAAQGKLAVAVSDLQEEVAELRAERSQNCHTADRDPEPQQSQAQAPSAQHSCDVALVFEGVPGITAGMGTRDARSIIADVLSHTLHIPDIQPWSFAISRVSKPKSLRPVVVVRVQERTVLTSIFASKTSKLMGRSCPIHIFTSQPPYVRPRAARDHWRQQNCRRRNLAVADPQPAAAASAAAVAAKAAADRKSVV